MWNFILNAICLLQIYTPPPLLRYTFNVKQFTNSCENLLSLVRIAVLRRVFPLPVPGKNKVVRSWWIRWYSAGLTSQFNYNVLHNSRIFLFLVDGNSLFHSCAMYIQGSPDVCFYFRNALFLTLQKNASSESGFYQRWKRNHEKSFAQSQAVCTEEVSWQADLRVGLVTWAFCDSFSLVFHCATKGEKLTPGFIYRDMRFKICIKQAIYVWYVL